MGEYQNYAYTHYKPQEMPDDGMYGAASPKTEPSSSFLGNNQRLAMKAVGGYAAVKIASTITSNVKSLTGSTAAQEKVNRVAFVVGSVGAAIATHGLSLVYQAVDTGLNYFMRYKNTQIENESKQEERKFLGKHITNSTGGAYYD